MSAERFPGAAWTPLPEHDEQGSHTKTQLIFHSTGTKASAEANARYFARRDIKVESTLIVNYDGSCLQVMPASARTDANGTANERAISVEVVGTADEPLTPEQLKTCIAIARWACSEHPIERRQIPSESESGIGWHVMFGAPGPWTSVRGKQCPGPRRIVQVSDQVIPAVHDGTTPPREDLTIMDEATKKYLDGKFAALSGGPRRRDAEGKVIDNDPQTLSVADVYTIVEDALAGAEERIIAAVKAAK